MIISFYENEEYLGIIHIDNFNVYDYIICSKQDEDIITIICVPYNNDFKIKSFEKLNFEEESIKDFFKNN